MALQQAEPNSLNGIEFAAEGREIDKRHLVQDGKRSGDVPAGLIPTARPDDSMTAL
jgi:hypothetical protein